MRPKASFTASLAEESVASVRCDIWPLKAAASTEVNTSARKIQFIVLAN